MTTKEILAQRLSQLREEAKIPRQKAADDLGVTRAALEFYELRCVRCGHIEVEWSRQDNTVDITEVSGE